MINTLISIFKIYDINNVLIHEGDSVDIIIGDKKRSLTLNDWINLNIALRRTYKKEINYLSKKDALFVYKGDLSMFKELSYE